MKSLIVCVIMLLVINCANNPTSQNTNNIRDGIYLLVSITDSCTIPQALIINEQKARLGTESKGIALMSVEAINNDSVCVVLKKTTENNHFRAIASRLPISLEEYEESSENFPFSGLYSNHSGNIVVAVKSDSVTLLYLAKKWNKYKKIAYMSSAEDNVRLKVGKNEYIEYSSPDSSKKTMKPCENGSTIYVQPLSYITMIGLDSLGR